MRNAVILGLLLWFSNGLALAQEDDSKTKPALAELQNKNFGGLTGDIKITSDLFLRLSHNEKFWQLWRKSDGNGSDAPVNLEKSGDQQKFISELGLHEEDVKRFSSDKKTISRRDLDAFLTQVLQNRNETEKKIKRISKYFGSDSVYVSRGSKAFPSEYGFTQFDKEEKAHQKADELSKILGSFDGIEFGYSSGSKTYKVWLDSQAMDKMDEIVQSGKEGPSKALSVFDQLDGILDLVKSNDKNASMFQFRIPVLIEQKFLSDLFEFQWTPMYEHWDPVQPKGHGKIFQLASPLMDLHKLKEIETKLKNRAPDYLKGLESGPTRDGKGYKVWVKTRNHIEKINKEALPNYLDAKLKGNPELQALTAIERYLSHKAHHANGLWTDNLPLFYIQGLIEKAEDWKKFDSSLKTNP